MNETQMRWMLQIVGFLGSVAAYTAVSRLLTPPPPVSDTDLSLLAKRDVGG